jgi:aminoglycoside phosphotransferase (APT) family kinase protein
MTTDDDTRSESPAGQPDYTVDRPQTSTRDYAVLRARLESWLRERLPGSKISGLTVPSSNGMSSETVLFDVDVPGEKEPRRLVARIAPDPAAEPVFRHYDMEQQFRTMQMVGEHTDVPVPTVHWLETDAGAIGAPFFVMERIEGVVPPDVMPYTYGDNWFFDASPEQQALLERRAIEVLAALHELGPEGPARFLIPSRGDRSALRRHVEDQRDYYEWVAGDGMRSPLIELGFDWLEQHWPAREGDPVFSWGDSRIGNMMFQDFSPVAVLDWEMASIGPREIDLGWMIYIHRFFQDLVEDLGMPGLPHVLRRPAVAAYYEQLTGYTPRDLDFFTLYAALRHGIVMFRIARRQAAFGEAALPDDPDLAILHHVHLRNMIEGTYWDNVTGS